jgi:hypothetical protein
MIDNTLYFLRAQLSVGNAWQNIAVYSILALLVKVVLVQHSLLKTRHKPNTSTTDTGTKKHKRKNKFPALRTRSSHL